MQANEMEIFLMEISRLSEASGEMLNEARMEIYFQDLAEFALSQVLEAMTWARKNLTHFPKIAELRMQIEGDPEVHADQAWHGLMDLLRVGEMASVIIHDRVMAKAIQELWGSWPWAYHQVGKAEGPIELGHLQRMFKRAYLEDWKCRDALPADVRFKGKTEIACDRGSLYFNSEKSFYIQTYRLAEDGDVQLVDTREIPSPYAGMPRLKLTPEMQARVDTLLQELGKGPTRDGGHSAGRPCCYEAYCGRPCRHGQSGKEPTRPAHHSSVPGRQDQPAPRVWPVHDPADELADHSPAPAPQPLRLIRDSGQPAHGAEQPGDCTCSGIRAGGDCNCPWNSCGQDAPQQPDA